MCNSDCILEVRHCDLTESAYWVSNDLISLGLFIYFLEISKILNISWNFEKFSMKFFSSNFPRNFKIFRIFPRNFEEIFEIFSRKISPNFSLKKSWNFDFFWNFEKNSRFFRDIFENTSKKSRIFLEISKKFEISRFFQGKIRRNFSSKISRKFPRNFEEKFEKSRNFEENSRKKFSSRNFEIFRNFEINSRFLKFREK